MEETEIEKKKKKKKEKKITGAKLDIFFCPQVSPCNEGVITSQKPKFGGWTTSQMPSKQHERFHKCPSDLHA